MNCVPLDGMAAASTLGRVSAAAARAGAGGLAEGPAGAAVGAGALATVVVGAGAGDAAAGAGAAGAAAAVRNGNPPEHCGPPTCSSQASVQPLAIAARRFLRPGWVSPSFSRIRVGMASLAFD